MPVLNMIYKHSNSSNDMKRDNIMMTMVMTKAIITKRRVNYTKSGTYKLQS